VAAVTGLSVGTLERLRRLGIGPVFVRIGPRALGYLESDLVVYLDARRARETPPKPPTTAWCLSPPAWFSRAPKRASSNACECSLRSSRPAIDSVWIEYAQTATALATIARQTVPGATGELLTGGVPSGETWSGWRELGSLSTGCCSTLVLLRRLEADRNDGLLRIRGEGARWCACSSIGPCPTRTASASASIRPRSSSATRTPRRESVCGLVWSKVRRIPLGPSPTLTAETSIRWEVPVAVKV